MNTQAPPTRGSIGELTLYFLRLGLLGFGGPVALVDRWKGSWSRSVDGCRTSRCANPSRSANLSRAACHPGGYLHLLSARWFLGAWAGGWAFIFPKFRDRRSVGALYVYLGDLQPVTAIFYGVSPAVIALILHSCYRLAKLGMEDPVQWAIAAVCLVVTVILKAEVALLFIGAGVIGILYYGNLFRRRPPIMLQVSAAPVLAQLIPVTSTRR